MERHKHGDIHQETGKVFWGYAPKSRGGNEIWLTPEKFAANKETQRKYSASERRRKTTEARLANPEIREKVRNYLREYKKSNKLRLLEKRRKYDIEYYRQLRANNPLYRLKSNLRGRIRKALLVRGFTKRSSLFSVLGCDENTLRSHIESKFADGMTWANYRLWHVDHIIPLSSAKSADEMAALCHYTNLQPLWAEVNQAKSDKMPNE